MIRQPSTAAQLYAWHRAAVSGDAPPVHDGIHECGWFKTRLVKGGPWVPVEIRVEREIDMETGELTAPERLVCRVDGNEEDPALIWTFLTPIPREEYRRISYLASMIPAMREARSAIDLSSQAMRP